MARDRVIIFVILAFLAGFVLGAVSGIRFTVKEKGDQVTAAQGQAPPAMQIRDLEAAVQRDPGDLQALVALGNAYFDTNQPAKAIGAYERALAIDPKNPDVKTDLGIMYRNTRDFDRALKEFREAARHDPFHKNSRYNIGVVLQNDKKDIPAAVKAWEDFLAVEPNGERADAVRGELARLRELAK